MSSSSPDPATGLLPSTTAEIERSISILISAVVLTSVSAVAVGMRFYVRAKLLRSVKSEDWCMLVSMFLGVGYGVFVILQSENGLGQHFENVPKDVYSAYRKWAYFGTMCYNLSLCLTKVSILLLYLRVLTHEYIRKVSRWTLAFVVVYNVWALGMYFTICIPLQKMWKPELEGYCHPFEVWWVLTYLHIVTDFMIFLIPIPVVVTMTIPMRQKIGLLVVFTLGLFVCTISVIRTVWLHQLLYVDDVTWYLVTIANWSTAEVNIAIICGCMPTLKPLLSKLFRPLMDRILPYHHQSLEDPDSTRPRTIGSMPLHAFRFGRVSKGLDTTSTAVGQSSRRSWIQGGGGTATFTDVERNQSELRNMDSQAELNPGGGGDDDQPGTLPRAQARDD